MAGNPASISAGLACLEVLKEPGVYERMEQLAVKLSVGLQSTADRHGVPLTINRIVGAFSTHFCGHPVTNYEEAQEADGEQFARFFRLMLDKGIYLAPSKYEAWFLTTAHNDADIEETLEAAEEAFQEMAAKT
jgi:glutamate-1-semialdehyde 2,1-aminomutase